MEKTKKEEYDALRAIEEILKNFSPEDTYIGKAFEGCVEQAKENIVSDFMMSYKDRYDRVSEQLHESEEARVDLVKQLNYKDDAIARLENVKNRLSEELEVVKAAYAKLEFKLEGAKETADGLKQTILELKAKLYDMMTAGEEVKE